MNKTYPYPIEKSLKLTYFFMSKPLVYLFFSQKWFIWYLLFSIITINTSGFFWWILAIIVVKIYKKKKKAKQNGIFDFSVKKSHEFDSTSYCSPKTSQIWYQSIDDSIFHIIKPLKTNFQERTFKNVKNITPTP